MYKKTEIAVQGIFSEKECLWFLNRGFDDCIYKVYPDKVRRAFKCGQDIVLADIYPTAHKITIEWLNCDPSAEQIATVVDFIKEWFDLQTDLTVFYELIKKEPAIAYMEEAYRGLRFIGMPDLFEGLCWGIIGQQINLTFAYALKRRLVELLGEYIDYEGDRYYLFPSPESLLSTDIDSLRTLQLSIKKAEYLLTIANAFVDHTLNKDSLRMLPDVESRIKFLTGLRGIGLWTANYTLMKSLKESSCIPYRDAGLMNALIRHGIIRNKTDDEAVSGFFNKFSGWESYLVFYFWRSLAI